MGRNEQLFRDGNATELLGDLLPEFRMADFSVVNLECPLVERLSPIVKDGPPLGAPVDCVNGLKACGIDAVGLANNHILDHGEGGLKSTITACEVAQIDCYGAGLNLEEAGRIYIREIKGIRVGFMAVAEHEFSIAGESSWGASPLDLVEIVRVIRRTRADFDFLIVLLHAGREHYRYPSPELQKVCRFLVEEGAGAVICQHTHCIGCFEIYQDSPIVYGQGNFIFDPLSAKKRSWHEGFLVKLSLVADSGISCKAEWIPFLQSLDKPGINSIQSEEKKTILSGFDARSREILVEGAVQKKWLEYCRAEKYLYASRIRGHNRLLRFLNRKLHFSDWLYSDTTKLIQRNVVECEIHREALETLWRDVDTRF